MTSGTPTPARSAARTPDISVVVPSHDRPLRLRWLLNSLEDQTLAQDRWEVIVAHDSSGPETDELLASHPLARSGVLRSIRLPPGTARPGANRNAGWRVARAPVVAFTDDDCRPPADWLQQVLIAVRRYPGAIVGGVTLPDPDEKPALDRSPFRHSQWIPEAPSPHAEACNIVYPRSLLERAGGFDETLLTGEDTDLMVRLCRTGAAYAGAQEMLTFHAIVPTSLLQRLRATRRWYQLPLLVKRHPELRRVFPGGVFWKRTHALLPLALAGAILERRNVLFGVLVLPWVLEAMPPHGEHVRGRVRSLAELPGRAAIDLAEMAVLVYGSMRYRTLFL